MLGALVIAAACGVALSACSSKDIAAGQTLVRVNNDEITVHQLNEELAHLDVTDMSVAAQTEQRKRVVDALIDRELLIVDAKHANLEHEPGIMQAMERAKLQILAQASLQKQLPIIAKPTQDEIDAYFKSHPDAYAQRKLYSIDQVQIANRDFTDGLDSELNDAKALEGVMVWLDLHKVPYIKTEYLDKSADLPPQMLEKLHSGDTAQLYVFKGSEKTSILFPIKLMDSPISPADANAEIADIIVSQKRKEATEAYLHKLRAAAKLEYVNLKSIGLSDPDMKRDDKPMPRQGGKEAESTERGVSGLK